MAPLPPPVSENDADSPEEPRSFWTKRRIGALGTGALVLLGLVIWQATRPQSLTPLEAQIQAIELLESGENTTRNRRSARALAESLQEIKFHDPDFPGAAEYILGIVSFREALAAEEEKRDEHYIQAVQFLRDAERMALNSQYRAEWAYALGSSLQAMGSPAEARPYIEEALASSPERYQELTQKLIEIYLELKTPSLQNKALELADGLLATLQENQAPPHDVDMAKLLKAQVLVSLKKTDEALAALPKLDPDDQGHAGMRIIQIQTLMTLGTRNGFERAKSLLQSLLTASGLTDRHARQAYYLLARCDESLGDPDRAINQYERTKSRYPTTYEGIAAALKQARLLQQAGRDEEALSAYQLALKSVKDPNTYHNRWVGIDEFRGEILRAWNSWVEADEFENAIALSKLMPPLFSPVQASELEARAFEKWAESYDRNNLGLLLKDPEKFERESRDRWNASGDAYQALGELLKSSQKYSDVLWKSAEHYIRGYRFKSAEEQLEICIATGPKERQPLAAVRLAYTKLNSDETEDALELLERVIRDHPKDPAAFQAAYLMGITYLEQNDVESAQKTWRDILESSFLSPNAREWRDALFALGNTLYHVTSSRIIANTNLEARLNNPGEANANPQDSAEENLESWDEAINKLNEYVRRYPNSPKHFEAQYLLARSYQRSANQYRSKLENAQIANERQELAEEYQHRLRIAGATLRELRTRLLQEEENAGLTPFLTRLMQNTYFDLGDIEFSLKEYDRALQVYSTAINRYPNHVRVLLSYLQMAECYEQLDKTEEARSTLKQAQILAQRMDEAVFQSQSTSLHDKQQWAEWFDWKLRMMSAP